MRSKSLAKVVVIELIISVVLHVLLIYRIVKYDKQFESTVSESATVDDDDESYAAEITRDDLHDLVNQYVASIDEEGVAEYITSSFGKVYTEEHYSLYNLTDSFDDLVVYSNVPSYNWLSETDWCASLYIDEDAASNADVDYENAVVSDVIETTVDVLDCTIPTYIFPYKDSVVVRAAILPDVILEVLSNQTTDTDIGLENFKSALDIRLVTD